MIKNYLSLIKFSHTIFAMPFAVIGFFLGRQVQPDVDWKIFLLVILCMIFARSAAMAFNRYADRKIDRMNERTAMREIPKGIIHEKSALGFAIIHCILFIITAKFINEICFYLSPVALFVILFYSYTKRFTVLSHLILGLGLSLAPIGAYLAVTGEFSLLPICFSLAVLFWVSGFDIIYALQDENFDRAYNLKSIPALLGKKSAIIISTIFHIITSSLIIFAGWKGNFSIAYWIGAGIFILLLVYQHTLVKANDLSKVNLAFFTMNGVASVIFSIFAVAALL